MLFKEFAPPVLLWCTGVSLDLKILILLYHPQFISNIIVSIMVNTLGVASIHIVIFLKKTDILCCMTLTFIKLSILPCNSYWQILVDVDIHAQKSLVGFESLL